MRHPRTHNELITTKTCGKYDHLLSLLYFVTPRENGSNMANSWYAPRHILNIGTQGIDLETLNNHRFKKTHQNQTCKPNF
jgi:hypothetical protein